MTYVRGNNRKIKRVKLTVDLGRVGMPPHSLQLGATTVSPEGCRVSIAAPHVAERLGRGVISGRCGEENLGDT